jgi:hypothetical protein
MSTGIASEPVKGSTHYPVPIVTAWPRILVGHRHRLAGDDAGDIAALVIAGGS